jgi:mono/diheme cytochrome c family protein
MRFLFVGFMMIAAAVMSRAVAAGTAVERGEYIFKASGCAGCHTRVKPKGKLLAGGRRLATPFGVFYPPNITSDTVHGIGAWSEGAFIRAMREGRAPDGTIYYPLFPYPSYTGMSDADLRDLWAYLRTVPAAAEAGPRHALDFPFNMRFLVRFWRWLYFTPGSVRPDAGRSAQWNRGAYLVRAFGHCGECHTPRNLLGGLDGARELAGNKNGPEGKRVSNITPHRKKGIGGWSVADIVALLRDGDLPSGDIAGGAMAEVVENSTAHLTERDLRAIADYLMALPADAGP